MAVTDLDVQPLVISPVVAVQHQRHGYLVPLLGRLQMDGTLDAGEPPADIAPHDRAVSCGNHGQAAPPMLLTWKPREGVFLLVCAACQAIAGAIRPAADA